MNVASQKIGKKVAGTSGYSKIGRNGSKVVRPAAKPAVRLNPPTGTRFDVSDFCKRYGLKRDLISRMTSYAPRTVADWAAGKPLKGAALLKIIELKRLIKALEELVEPESIGPWFQTQNEAFEGSTPAQLVERGESDRLWRMIHLLESGQPG
jgi:hypothetical protein